MFVVISCKDHYEAKVKLEDVIWAFLLLCLVN